MIAEDFDGEMVILNLDDGRYFSLRGAGSSVWKASSTAGAAPQSIVDMRRSHRPALVDSTLQFVQFLSDLQLIRAVGNQATASGMQAVDWSSVGDGDQPAIEVFEDLAEMIMADPIHDVDAETGWPIRKAA